MIRRIRPLDVLEGRIPDDGGPYVCDCRSIDIASTIAAAVRNAPSGLIAISLRPYGARMIAAAERAARRRGARIIWLPYGARRHRGGGNSAMTVAPAEALRVVLARITGTVARESTLFTTVGFPKSPEMAGRGGFARTTPRFPSRLSSIAVSSPQM